MPHLPLTQLPLAMASRTGALPPSDRVHQQWGAKGIRSRGGEASGLGGVGRVRHGTVYGGRVGRSRGNVNDRVTKKRTSLCAATGLGGLGGREYGDYRPQVVDRSGTSAEW